MLSIWVTACLFASGVSQFDAELINLSESMPMRRVMRGDYQVPNVHDVYFWVSGIGDT
jgi:hypothetical protein